MLKLNQICASVFFNKTKEMKHLILITLIMMGALSNAQSNFHDFTVKDIDGKNYALNQLRGKKVLVVNVASKCGFTPQYEDLQKLYETYKDKNFMIIGFPANNFLKQEPGTNEEIKSFCSLNYGVTFPIMAKISVKGSDIHPVYEWLTEKDKNGKESSKVKWNFQKYMIDANGSLVGHFGSSTKPFDPAIVKWIEEKE